MPIRLLFARVRRQNFINLRFSPLPTITSIACGIHPHTLVTRYFNMNVLLPFLVLLGCLICDEANGDQGALTPNDLQRLKAFYCLLGVKSKDVQDYDMTASSSLAPAYESYFGRLDAVNTAFGGGAWCSSNTTEPDQWIQIDLRNTISTGGVVTQGLNGPGHNWVTSFKVACDSSFITENGTEKVFVGNSDSDTKIFNSFPAPVTCRQIRIYPQSWNNATCMRLDVLGGNCQGRKFYQFSVKSSGANDQNFAEIKINGVDYAPNTRGHNVVVMNAETLQIESHAFDTWGSIPQTQEMIAYLKRVPYGSLVAIAIKDSTEPSHMTDDDVAFMKTLGAGGPGCPIRVAYRNAWAFVTEKIMPGLQFPDWKNCSHVPRYGGTASVSAAVNFERFYYVADIPMST